MRRQFVLRLAGAALASGMVSGTAAAPPFSMATVLAGPTPAWWTRTIVLTPHGDSVGRLTLATVNAALRNRKHGDDAAPICAIQPLDWSTLSGEDAATRAAIAEAAARYPDAFMATMMTRPGRSVVIRVVAYRRCQATDPPGLAILTISTEGRFDDFAPVPWPFVRLRPVTPQATSLFNCLDCATPVGTAAPDDWIRHAGWRPLTPLMVSTRPPAWLGADPFYTKYVDADGIPILASAKVTDRALLAARAIIHDMLRFRPRLGRVLVAQGQRIALLADDEAITDLPQNRDWKKPTIDDPRLTYCERKLYDVRIGRLSDRDYWNRRERAVGGVFLADAAEDVLGQRSSRWYGETILIHEFAHRLLDAVQIADPDIYASVVAAYRHAQATGLWTREYASTNLQEYWAEGTQFWFNSNMIAIVSGRRILSDADLKAYDPLLYATLARVYGRRHHIAADPFYDSPARVPPGPLPQNTAEKC